MPRGAARTTPSSNHVHSYRRDTAHILHELAEKVVRRNAGFPVPADLDRKRVAGPVLRHVAQPQQPSPAEATSR